jgi:hypothetical protein
MDFLCWISIYHLSSEVLEAVLFFPEQPIDNFWMFLLLVLTLPAMMVRCPDNDMHGQASLLLEAAKCQLKHEV